MIKMKKYFFMSVISILEYSIEIILTLKEMSL